VGRDNPDVRLLILHPKPAYQIFTHHKWIELRTTRIKQLGRVGIQVAGAHQVIGAVDIRRCREVTYDEVLQYEDAHCVPKQDLEKYGIVQGREPFYFWEFNAEVQFETPIAHRVKRGAQIFEVVRKQEKRKEYQSLRDAIFHEDTD
jgi:hypothetical protein